ncbi:MAG: cysteine rich repeat-containing protein [Thermodesulfobacteriota bacterium]
MKLRTLGSCAAAVACILSVSVARAEMPCAADIATLCKDVPAGGGRIQACLEENEAKVSSACRAKIDSLAGEVKLAAVVCRWDIGRLCSDVVPGKGQLASCLERHEDDLSPECRKQLADMKK